MQSVPKTHVAKELLTAMDAGKPGPLLAQAMSNALRTPMKGHNQVKRKQGPQRFLLLLLLLPLQK